MKPLLQVARDFGLAALFAQVVVANVCYTTNGIDSPPIATSISISNQTDADRQLGNCTTVKGNLYIGSEYTGSLNISTITNVTGDIYSQSSALTSLALDNLLYVDDIRVNNYGNLTSLSLSSLLTATTIWVTSNTPIILSVPALVNAKNIQLYGNYSTIDFSHLENGNISLNSMGFYTSPFFPIDLAFPSLKTSYTFEVYGNISSIFVPKLRTSGSIGANSHRPLNLTFPSLFSAGEIELVNIANLSMPSLYSAKDLEITVSKPTKLSFPALVNGSTINISGNATDVQLPLLKYCPALLSIYTDTKVDCSSAKAALSRVQAQQKADKVTSSYTPYFTCMQKTVWDEDAFMRNHNLSMALGFGLGFGIPLSIIASCCIWVFWKRYTYKRDNRLSNNGDARAYVREQKRLAKERERSAKLKQKLAVLDARREKRQEEMRKKIKVMHKTEANGEQDSDLGVFRMEEVATPPTPPPPPPPPPAPTISVTAPPAWTGREEDGNPDDPPPLYEEGSSSGYAWETRSSTDAGEGSSQNRWRDGEGQFTEEETELLKGRR